MAIKKSISFAAPYTSATFNNEELLNVGRSGVITGCEVSTSGSAVAVQPGSFIQNGLIVSFDTSLTTALPSGLVAPYSIVVTTSSSVENPAEVITPTFAQRPEDISGNSVILADWDGQEWISREHLQLNDILEANQEADITKSFVGVSTGFDVSSTGGNLVVTPGTLIGQQGESFAKTLTESFPKIAVDADGLLRTDDIVYRRPSDDSSRPGSLQYVVGPVYNASSTVQVFHETEIGNTAYVNSTGKTLNVASSNTSLFLFIQDYGARAQLMLRTSPDLMSSVTTAVAITTGLTSFDASLNISGSIDLVYIRGNNVYYQQVTTAGSSVVAETLVASNSLSIANVKLASVVTGSVYYMHIVYELIVSGSVHQLWYVRLSSAAVIQTAKLLLVDLSSVVTNPSVAKDDTDCLLLVAYENTTTGKVYYREYDASTATSVSIPTQIGTTVELESDTYVISSETVLPANGAMKPIIRRAANKETFVFWLQNKGSAYGVAVYNKNYIDWFGYSALMQDLITSGEDIGLFDVQLDGLCNAHFILGRGTGTYKASLQLESMDVLGTTTELDTIYPSAVATNFNAKGSLVQSWSYPSIGTANNGSPLAVQYIGPGLFPAIMAIASNEFVLLASDYSTLPIVPALGDSVTLASAGPDSGTFIVTGSRTYTEASVNYVAIATSATFTMQPSGPSAQFLTQAGTNLYIAKTTAGVYTNMRSYNPIHTDVIISQYSSPSGDIAVIPEAIDNRPSITRLYEYVNCMSGSGQVDWQITGANQYSFTSPIYLNFIDRVSAYQIAAIPGGATLLAGQVSYVQIPDSDEDVTLTLETVFFGDQVLDRNNNNIRIIFWNIGGKLYSNLGNEVNGGYVLTYQVPAGQNLTEGQIIYISEGGVTDGGRTSGDAYPLDCSALGAASRAVFAGIVTQSVTAGNIATIVFLGLFNSSGLTPGAVYYADPSTPGGITSVPPGGGGIVTVPVGIAISASVLLITSGLGGGGGVTQGIFYDETIGSGDGSTVSFALTKAPLNASAVFVFVNNRIVPISLWNLVGQNVVFDTAPVLGQQIYVQYLLANQSYMVGVQEVPVGAVNGTNTTFAFSQYPTNQGSVFLFLNERIVPSSQWSLVQSGGVSTAVFNTAPALGQAVYAAYFLAAGAVASGLVNVTNMGGGAGNIFQTIVAGTVRLRTLVAGTNVTIVQATDTITISAAGGGGGSGALSTDGSVGSPNIITPSGGISILNVQREIQWVAGVALSGAQAVTANPQVQAGATIGQELILRGTSASDYPVLNDGTGLSLQGPANMTSSQALYMVWNGSVWDEISRRF